MKILNRINLVIPAVFLGLILLGSWIGREDIIENCNDTGTFKQGGVTYTCGVIE